MEVNYETWIDKIYIFLALLVISTHLNAQNVLIGLNTIEVPDNFKIMTQGGNNFIAKENDNILSIQIKDKNKFDKFLSTVEMMIKVQGGTLNEKECISNCRAFYSEFPVNGNGMSYVYLVKTDNSIIKINYKVGKVIDSLKSNDGKEFVEVLLSQLLSKPCKYQG